MAKQRPWIGALILIGLGILISSAKNGRMDLRGGVMMRVRKKWYLNKLRR
jgi:hypothetical protein